ncbi:amino acid adenylation domain-containing protein [Streptomyces sp. NPDC028635]|uniref:amino acid adenylation domain-containing protein n=1 Tax=Streptomyces sp. NPDC028635 TaxID=3154800 RepID=UPI00340C5159
MTKLQPPGERQTATAAPGADRARRLPLTEDQLGLLLQHRADPAASPYNVPLAVDLRGPLDTEALEAALARTVARHPLLSARVADDEDGDGLPLLDLDPARVPRLERRTASTGPDGVWPARAVAAEARRELDLEHDGVLRAVLVRHAPEHHTLLLVVHHVVVDGESTGILLADLLAAYEHGDVPGPAPAAEFDAYVTHRAAEAARDTAAAEAYWLERLDGADLTVDFPHDTPGGATEACEAAVPLDLDADLWDRVRAFSRTHRAGAAAVLLAAYLKALATYGRQSAATVGVPLGARTDPRFDRTVGHFVRTLLVRAPEQRPGDGPAPTAAAFVTAVQTELARAVDHARLPFPRIARLAPGDADRPPFNCTFVLHSWADATSAATDGVALREGLRAHWRQDVHAPGLGLLTLELYEGESGLHGRLKYDASRVDAATAEAFTEHIATLAAQLVADPDRPVADLDGLGPRARATLDFLNATDHPVPDTDIDTLLRERAADRGDATAVEFGDSRWSYRELDERVDAYAAGLETHGVRAGDRVGVLLPRSDEAVAAMLAVLRAGAAYVPLDASHPEVRRRHIVDSSGMRLALVDPDTASACPSGPRQLTLADLAVRGGRPRLPGPDGRSALHVLYTSGSTGLPKGVQLSHRALVTDILAAIRHFGIGPDDAVLLKAPFTFDVSAHEMLVALVAGARLIVAPPDAERDPDLLAETLDRHAVTLLHAVPSQLRLLLEARAFAANRTLRTVVSTGEALPNELRSAFEAVHPARLHNAYGPTETSYSTVFSWSRGEDAFWTRRAEVPIGVPFDNIRCYVLDEDLRLLPPGAPGELWIGGGTVSDGYVGDPARTADRYRSLRLGGRTDTVYRTGDLVRLLPGGVLTHLGRLDDQVKINGNRVELGEVRAALAGLDGVEDAAVQVARHAGGSLQIVAHVVTRVAPGELRAALRPLLPSHMIPAHIHQVPRIPLLPNGKTDRRALAQLALPDTDGPAARSGTAPAAGAGGPERTGPSPDAGARPAGTAPAAPGAGGTAAAGTLPPARPATQPPGDPAAPPNPGGTAGDAAPQQAPAASGRALEAVRAVWADLLGSASDDAQFFEAGGDSILAMQLVSRLRREGFSLVLREIYRHPVLADLAAHLGGGTDERQTPGHAPAARTAAAPAPSGGASPLAPVQAWFFRHIRTDLHQWNQSVLLQLNRPVDPTTLRLALQAVVAAHPALSARFERDGDDTDPAGRLMVAAEPFAAYPPRDVLWERHITDESGFDRALEDAEGSLDPLKGVHVRAVLVHDRRSPATPAHLLIAVHHLVVDGVSWRVLLEDLEHALTALADGVLPALPPEACRYEDWVAALPAVAERPGEADHWRALAAARQEAHTLLLTTPAPDEERIRRVEFSLDPEVTARLIGPLPARLGLQVHQVMTGAFAQALARWRGARTVTFDVETHGRHGRDDLYRTVGWFTSIHPVVLGADRALPPERYLARISADLNAVPDGGVGFGACREFSPDPALRTLLRELPPALVCFNYYGQADQLSPSGGFTMSERPIPREHSARCERVYGIEVYGIVHGGRLRMGLTWVPSPADGVDEAGVDALVAQLAWVLATLAGADPHTVVPAEIAAPGAAAPAPRPAAQPALPAADGPETVPVTPQQHGLLLDALAHQGTGRYVEQLFWRWHGPLDTDRFTAAWQSVFDRETVLRAAFDWQDEPRLVLHDDVSAEVTRHAAGSVDWEDLTRRDLLRGFDLRSPGLLRVNLLDEAAEEGAQPSVRILLTFHHVLLDGWSVSVLVQEFYRAYLAGGLLAGGERRPDIRDYARWLKAQDTAPAREFWSSAVPDTAPLVRPAVPGPATGQSGSGRAEVRIGAADADRLRAWAASCAATESSALQAVWALLLYRAGGVDGAAPVGFGVTVSGRGIALDAVERLPGLLMNSLPMTIRVDPSAEVTRLLTELRDQALDMAAYEWVSTGQIHEWSGRRPDERLVESLIVFENYPRTSDDLESTLAEHGISVELPDAAGSQTAFPVTLLAYRDVDGSLVLAAVHDRARLADAEAERLVAQCARLLRELPGLGAVTVTDVLTALSDEAPVRMADAPAAPGEDITEVSWPDAPETELVKDAWTAVFGGGEVDPGTHFFDAGGHSLLAVRLLREIAQRTGRTLRLDDLITHPRAGQLARLLADGPEETDGSSAADAVLVPLRPAGRPGAGTVYLVHPPGGQVACYAQLAREYQGPHALVGIRDPRVDDPEPAHLSTEDLAERYLDALRPALERGERIVLGGFSGGGVVAYEIAQRVVAEGGRPPLVVMVDAGAPDGDLTDAEADGSFARRLREVAEGRTPSPAPSAAPGTEADGGQQHRTSPAGPAGAADATGPGAAADTAGAVAAADAGPGTADAGPGTADAGTGPADATATGTSVEVGAGSATADTGTGFGPDGTGPADAAGAEAAVAAPGSGVVRAGDASLGDGPSAGATAEPEGADAYLAELAQIAEWMRGDGGGDPVALMRDSVEAVQRYRPRPYAGPVVVLRAGDTGFGRGTAYDESDRFHRRPGLGWEDHVEDLAIRVVPGNHVTMLTGDNVRRLARILASALTN